MKLTKLVQTLPKHLSSLAKYRQENFANEDHQLDYAELLARTSEEFNSWYQELTEVGKLVEEGEILGARNLFMELKQFVDTPDGALRYLVISEPIRNKVYPKYGLVALSYYAPEFAALKRAKSSGKVDLTELERQGDCELMLLAGAEAGIIFRSHSLSKEVLNRNKPMSDAEKVLQLKEELDKLRSEVRELEQDRVAKLQIMADFQNYRKRMDKERASFGLIANMTIVGEVLDVLDDVQRTIADDTKDLARSEQMFQIIRDKLLSTVAQVGLEQITVNVGDTFSSSKMEAVGTVAVPSVDDHNKVVSVIQPGYKYSDRDQIMRMAKVIVGKKDTSR